MWDRFPPRMRNAITTTLDQAGRRGRAEASTEDLLLAITRDPECAAMFMFEHAGVPASELASRLDGEAPQQAAGEAPSAKKLSDAAVALLHAAIAQADRLNHRHVGTEHVALALARAQNASAAADLLKSLGFTPDRADAAMRAWIAQGMPRRRLTMPAWVARLPLVGSAVIRLTRMPMMLWAIFVRKSLGHPKFVRNPYPLYRKLRETEPLRKDPLAPVWVITTYAGMMAMLRDPRFRKDPFAAERLPRAAREQLEVSIAAAARASAEMTSMLFLDPPQHTRVRAIFTKAFTPRRLESLRPRIQQITDGLLDAVAPSGTMDLIRDFAAPLPVTVIAELLGFPAGDFAKIKRWSDDMADALALNPSTEAQLRAYRARDEIRVYFDGVVQNLRRSPGDNLLSALLALEAEGEGLTDGDELFVNSILLLAAGHETTTHLIGNGMLALLGHPDQLDDLRRHPEVIVSAVEELLRYDSPVQWTSRVAAEDFAFAGKQLRRGDILLASVGAANRDPAVFSNPDQLDVRRADNKHLSFGTGIHFCLGAALARMEAQIAIATLLRRYSKLKLAKQRVKWKKGLTFRGVEELRLLNGPCEIGRDHSCNA